MVIRRTKPADRERLLEIHASAFRRADGLEPPEVALFAALARAGDILPELSLAADVDGVTVGHVVGSRATVRHHAVAAVGPIGVLPRHQGRGIGTVMMHTLLEAAEALDLPLVGLLGAPAYYARFGFRPATSLGIEPPDPRWGDEFQVRALAAFHPGIAGRFAYAPAFDAVAA
jgi:putative acetyltransferase